jgi:ABC-type multidrug transport system ATPase subunit
VTQKDATLRRIIEKINTSEVAVFGVMDYWTFDGFIEIRNYVERNPGALKKTVLPGIELRLEAPTEHRLNTHVILSDAVSTATLTTFVHTLRCGGAVNKPPTRETLIEVGRSYAPDKLQALGFTAADKTDDEKMFLAGAQSVVITRDSLRQAIQQVGKDHCLVLQPYDTYNGLEDLDWKAHPYDDQELMRMADIFEAKKEVHINLFLGLGYSAKPEVQDNFMHNLGGCPKPAFRGSDAHKVDDYGKYPNDRIAWLKADPTFLGLKQVCHEPASRCYVGPRPPKLLQVDKNPTKYIRSIKITRLPGADPADRWFDGVDVKLNPGLIAVIGNKGSGKSAFADIDALLGNTRSLNFEFLNSQRFRKGRQRAQYFNAELTWEDNTTVSKTLDLDPDPQEPERVRYLPQRAIEDLCNELNSDGPSDFEGELKKVIFSHVPPEQQMQKESLDELLDFKTGPSKEAIRQLQKTLTTLNGRIVQLEGDTSASKIESYKSALALKKAELDAHQAAEPQPPPAQPTQQATATDQTLTDLNKAKEVLNALTTERENLKAERIGLFTKLGQVTNVLGKLTNLETQVEQFTSEITPDLEKLGVKAGDIFSLKVDRKPIKKIETAAKDRVAAITLRLDGDPANPETASLEKSVSAEEAKIKQLQDKLDAPQRAQQEFLTKKAAWQKRKEEIIGAADKPETKAFYEAKITAATSTLPQELTTSREERRALVRNIHAQLIQQRTEYETYYKPVQTIATESPLTKKALKLDFAVFLSPTTFEDQILGLINRQRRGAFQGEEDGAKKLHEMVSIRDFGKADEVIALLDGIVDGMSATETPGATDRSLLTPQLRKDVKLADFYDALYSLKYLEPRYTLRLDGKEITELSPGEKGALLLVFYLLLDQEEIPIIIDQPEQNLDNESVVRLLVDCIRRARERRQVILVTHNPNLAIVCDADQIVCSKIDKANGSLITYVCGSIENPKINARSVDVLEGTFPAFDNRRIKWMKPK